MLLHTCTQLAKPRQTTLNFNFADRKCVAQNVVHSLGSGILPKMRNFTFCIFLAPQFTNIACHFKHTHHTQHTHAHAHTEAESDQLRALSLVTIQIACTCVCVCVCVVIFVVEEFVIEGWESSKQSVVKMKTNCIRVPVAMATNHVITLPYHVTSL